MRRRMLPLTHALVLSLLCHGVQDNLACSKKQKNFSAMQYHGQGMPEVENSIALLKDCNRQEALKRTNGKNNCNAKCTANKA